MTRNICRDRLSRLLRYGRKNSGSWDEGEECDCIDPHCNMLDDGDVEDIIAGLALLDESRDNAEKRAHVCHACDGTGFCD